MVIAILEFNRTFVMYVGILFENLQNFAMMGLKQMARVVPLIVFLCLVHGIALAVHQLQSTHAIQYSWTDTSLVANNVMTTTLLILMVAQILV